MTNNEANSKTQEANNKSLSVPQQIVVTIIGALVAAFVGGWLGGVVALKSTRTEAVLNITQRMYEKRLELYPDIASLLVKLDRRIDFYEGLNQPPEGEEYNELADIIKELDFKHESNKFLISASVNNNLDSLTDTACNIKDTEPAIVGKEWNSLFAKTFLQMQKELKVKELFMELEELVPSE